MSHRSAHPSRRVAILRALFLTCAVAAASGLSAGGAAAQEAPDAIGATLTADAAVKAALASVQANEPALIEEQVKLCEVPAPPFMEQKRGEMYRDIFTSLGLKNVRVDAVGNVIGERPGAAPRPNLVFTAHLDTVFPEGTPVKVTKEGATLYKGPGISDDCRGLAVVLGVIRALDAGKVKTPGTITFVGTVGEEGLGDLRGVKHLFNTELKDKIDRFVSVDGTGYGITHIGVGSKRYRVTFKGPGGHSYGAFGMVNPIHALARAINTISDFQVPSEPKTTFNVGRIGGGTSVNAIPFEAWAEVDMRSADAASLATVDKQFQKAVTDALSAEMKRWREKGQLTVDPKLVGDRPAGSTPVDSPIVKAAVSVTKALNLPILLDEGSTDANVAMQMKIPAITIDGGGKGNGAHALTESFDSTDSWKGTQRALLVAIALAQK
jgi:acetylornithine deacetylase/succinyl-diaminopimelate desuccinylase-like protein